MSGLSGRASLKRLTTCSVTFGFLLGLVGCTEHNPAFHKPVDGGVNPPQDVAATDSPSSADHPPSDTPSTVKDAEPRSDTPGGSRETGLDSPKLVDGESDVRSDPPDALGPDGRKEVGPDTVPLRDTGLDTLTDGIQIPPDVISRLDGDQRDVPTLPEDALSVLDGSEGDATEAGDAWPDSEEPDVVPDVAAPEPDSHH
jgi:hypothetical protein